MGYANTPTRSFGPTCWTNARAAWTTRRDSPTWKLPASIASKKVRPTGPVIGHSLVTTGPNGGQSLDPAGTDRSATRTTSAETTRRRRPSMDTEKLSGPSVTTGCPSRSTTWTSTAIRSTVARNVGETCCRAVADAIWVASANVTLAAAHRYDPDGRVGPTFKEISGSEGST